MRGRTAPAYGGTPMPRGTRHRLSGTLCWDGRCYILKLSEGGYWFLDMPLFSHARPLVGCMITVEGTRSGFNWLDVVRIDR
jgi:hypothetical protein